jgi:hypothetical protein
VPAQFKKSRDYETYSQERENRPAQPPRHWLFAWSRPAHKSWVEFIRREAKSDGNHPNEYLNNCCCQLKTFLLV